MEAILLVGHGSRDPEGNVELLRFADMVRSKAPQFLIETCFLEFAKPNIDQGIANCVAQGATRVVLVPIILFAAGHAKLHIPDAIDHAKRKYPNVQFVYGRPIGVHQKVINILKSRLAEAGYTRDLRAIHGISKQRCCFWAEAAVMEMQTVIFIKWPACSGSRCRSNGRKAPSLV